MVKQNTVVKIGGYQFVVWSEADPVTAVLLTAPEEGPLWLVRQIYDSPSGLTTNFAGFYTDKELAAYPVVGTWDDAARVVIPVGEVK